MSNRPLRRRALIGLITVSALFAPVVAANGAYGDQISDKRAEAARVADKLDQLEMQAEQLAEQYNDARLALADVETKVTAAAAKVERTQSVLAGRRKEMAGYAVSAYVQGDQAGDASILLTSEDTNAVGRRRGYAQVTTGNRADLVDRLRGAEAAAQADVTNLNAAKAKAAKAKATVDAKRAAAQHSVDEQRTVYSKVKGELAKLVEAERARRAAEAARKAAEAARRLAAQQAAARQAAAQAAPQRNAAPEAGPTTEAPAAAPENNGGGGGNSGGGAPTAAPDPSPPVGVGAGAAIAAAQSVLGVRYTWAGASPSSGFDCSGLVMWAWQHGGKSLPHSSAAMYGMSRHISMSELQPGDLVFYGSPIHHVALYIGGGQIIHSPHTGSYVQVASVNYWSDVAGAGRV